MLKLPLSTWLPSVDDCLKLREELATLVERILVQNLSEFSFLETCVSQHISHKYSSFMAKKSEFVSCHQYYHYYYADFLIAGTIGSSSEG